MFHELKSAVPIGSFWSSLAPPHIEKRQLEFTFITKKTIANASVWKSSNLVNHYHNGQSWQFRLCNSDLPVFWQPLEYWKLVHHALLVESILQPSLVIDSSTPMVDFTRALFETTSARANASNILTATVVQVLHAAVFFHVIYDDWLFLIIFLLLGFHFNGEVFVLVVCVSFQPHSSLRIDSMSICAVEIDGGSFNRLVHLSCSSKRVIKQRRLVLKLLL